MSASPRTYLELARGPGALAQVGTDTECVSRTGDDGYPRFLVVTKPREGVVEVAPHLGIDCVQCVGAVVSDGGHMALEAICGRISHNPILPVREQVPRVERAIGERQQQSRSDRTREPGAPFGGLVETSATTITAARPRVPR